MIAPPEHAATSDLEETGARLVGEVLKRCGEARLRVGGTSMLPTIRPGDVLLIRPVEITSVEPGEVILFRAGGRLFVHRVVQPVVSGADRILITRGDNHAHPDQPVTAVDLLGRVDEQLRDGAAVAMARAPLGQGRRTEPGRAFDALCRMRRFAELLRSSVPRGARRLGLLGRAAKPGWRSAQSPVDVG
ncbi:MAG: signal peptidase I [Acidobacteriota bacterium]